MKNGLANNYRYVKERKLFGKPLSNFRIHSLPLPKWLRKLQLAEALIDDLIHHHIQGHDIVKETCMAKYWIC
jgi:acyl-CoA dehydrogenase